ncbi:putative site-specific integrase-resolvase [Planomicrobium stackebrandtii]|uniref:Site-specific integrase-resolvase n=1 Tax=Planomicrobium stackebrandtii TaxID=253160 RepID=A0ABU0GUH1_9BACL|nr:hypothetical protein [Planomicrobium stackebrandtii]MDQ0428604.1 putative site-specific integrase-resolvase [Planomicrobium stackebrandtii]
MENIPTRVKLESIESFQSTIRKLEKALAQMIEKGASTSLIEKRLQALRIGLAVLERVWHEQPHPYSQEELAKTREVLAGLLPSIESMCAKSKSGSPQRTLLEKRIRSLELAIKAIAGIFT